MAFTLGKCSKGSDCKFEHSKHLSKIAEKMLKKGAGGHAAKGDAEPARQKSAGEGLKARCHHCGRSNHSATECKHRDVECTKCSRKGHVAKICPGDEPCSNCNRRGHIAKVCFRDASAATDQQANAGKGGKKGGKKKGEQAVKGSGHGKGSAHDAAVPSQKGKGGKDHLSKQTCRSWIKNGKCDYKDGVAKCLRKHPADLKGKGAHTPCEMFLAGECRFGKDCMYNHNLKAKKANVSFGGYQAATSSTEGGDAGSQQSRADQEARIEERILAALDKQLLAHDDPDRAVGGKTQE
jgi:hypothetical protein